MLTKSILSCLTLCDTRDCSLPGSSVHGILQTRILEWAAMPSSRGSSQPRDQTHALGLLLLLLTCFSRVQLFTTPWTAAHQAFLSMGFSRQEYWSGLPCPPPGDLPSPGIKSESPAAPAFAGRFFTTERQGSPHDSYST